jgi:hypothetical protein
MEKSAVAVDIELKLSNENNMRFGLELKRRDLVGPTYFNQMRDKILARLDTSEFARRKSKVNCTILSTEQTCFIPEMTECLRRALPDATHLGHLPSQHVVSIGAHNQTRVLMGETSASERVL